MQMCYFDMKTSQSKAFSVPSKGIVHMDYSGTAHVADTSTLLQMFLHLKTKSPCSTSSKTDINIFVVDINILTLFSATNISQEFLCLYSRLRK